MQLHSRKRTARGPQNDGPWKAGNGTLYTWHFFDMDMLDFWGVMEFTDSGGALLFAGIASYATWYLEGSDLELCFF